MSEPTDTTCRRCPLYATETVPFYHPTSGRRWGEFELLTCGHWRHVLTDTAMCAWWREHCAEPEIGQMRLELR